MNRTYNRLGFMTLALVAGATSVGYAQETGSLVVNVKDQGGKPVAGATLIATSPTQIGGARTVKTDATGRARFGLLYPGDFTVQVIANGFTTSTLKNLRVGVSNVATAEVKLALVSQAVVEVISSQAAIDTTSSTSATRIGLETVDSLPTARTYTDYIKLVPGVIASPDSGNNPVLAGSLGRDNTGVGGAKNNTYILDGMDSTDPYTGKASTRFNSEIIQEQEIKTGGITAEVGSRGGGLVSNVITKSGSNSWTGSVNYYFQNNNLVAPNKPGTTPTSNFNAFDSAFTFGGPIIKDRLWFFSSVQLTHAETKGEFNSTAVATPTAKNAKSDTTASFFKLTWAPTDADQLEFSYNADPTKEKSAGSTTSIPARDYDREIGGSRFALKYDHEFGAGIHLTVKGYKTENKTDITPFSAARRVDLIYPDSGESYGVSDAGDVPSRLQQLGGLGWYTNTTRTKEGFDADVSWLVGNLAGEHVFKAGISSFTEGRKQKLNNGYGADYENLFYASGAPTLGDVENDFAGASWADGYAPDSVLGPRYDAGTLPADLMAYLSSLPGETGADKVRAIPMVTPDTLVPGSYLQYRIQGLRTGTATVKRKTQEFFLQDNWAVNNNWVVYLGVRFNKDSYYADDGTKLHTTELNVAPRLGATWTPVAGLKVYATHGRYFEPIKLDMVNFAGSFANSRIEQLYIGGTVGRWVDVRQRGGRETVDAMLAPTLQSPYTDESRLGLEKDLGNGWVAEAIYTHRKDQRLVEDFDMLYTDPATVPNSSMTGTSPGRIAVVLGGTAAYWQSYLQSLAIPLSHFGFTSVPQNVNYVLANLPGGKRQFDVFDLVLRRNLTAGWQGMFSATFTKATGNSLSSGDADYQGDTSRVDPRTPWMNGTLIGSIDRQVKGYLSYTIQDGWAKGLNIGGTGTYLSGQHYTRGLYSYGRILQGPFIDNFDPRPGLRLGPSYSQIDLRFKYNWTMAAKVKGEVFIDVFNAFNWQATTAVDESSNAGSGAPFGAAIAWQQPRRFYVGARFSF